MVQEPAISCAKMYVALGVKKDNIIMFDSKGPININRDNLSNEKEFITKNINVKSLDDALNGADVFIGLSKADMMSVDMLKSMSENPIVFAMANPDPEINYKQAKRTREDLIIQREK